MKLVVMMRAVVVTVNDADLDDVETEVRTLVESLEETNPDAFEQVRVTNVELIDVT